MVKEKRSKMMSKQSVEKVIVNILVEIPHANIFIEFNLYKVVGNCTIMISRV